MSGYEPLLPPNPSPRISAETQFYLREKAKKSEKFQFFTDFVFLAIFTCYYIFFVSNNSCLKNSTHCIRFGDDFNGTVENYSNQSAFFNPHFSSEEIYVYEFTTLTKFVMIPLSWLLRSYLKMQTRKSDTEAMGYTSFLLFLRIGPAITDIAIHLFGGINLQANTSIAVLRLVFYWWPLMQLVYIVEAICCYVVVSWSLSKCLEGRYLEDAETGLSQMGEVEEESAV